MKDILPVKGFRDYTGKEAEKRAVIMEIVKGIFQKYGFSPAETPLIEKEEFVKGDNKLDEAVSDIYKLKDKGKRKLALRYEFTFQIKRLIENKKFPYKRYQIGPVFRDEPVKENRLRQFTTCEVDIIGVENNIPKYEAEILAVIKEILESLKIEFEIYINNRKLLNEILEKYNIKNKEQIIREIDKLDKLSEKQIKENLKRFNAEKILEIFKKSEKYFEMFDSYKEIKELKNYASYYGIKLNFQPSLARGLSYYKGNIFEIKTRKIKETICGGGTYELNNIKGIGFGMSIERLACVTNMLLNLEKFLVVSIEQDKKAISIAQKLRKAGKNVSIFYGKLSKALEYANAYQIKKVIFVGKNEIQQKRIKIRNMNTGKEIKIETKNIHKI